MAMVLEASGLRPSSSPVFCPSSSSTIARHSSFLPLCSSLRLRTPLASSPLSRNSSQFSTQIVCEKPSTAPAAGSSQNLITEAGVVNDKTWQQLVLESDIPVAVDFWAPWCGPCRMIAPLFEELARQYAGRVRCLKLNTDESPNTATDYGIRSIPTVMIFKGGQKKDAIIGAVPKATLVSTIEKYLDR